MPHDINGMKLEAGDEVVVRCTITSVQPGTDYCNLSLETVEPMFPGDHKSSFTLNGKQVQRLQAPGLMILGIPATNLALTYVVQANNEVHVGVKLVEDVLNG